MNYSETLQELKKGERIAREAWNGKGMFICLLSKSMFVTLHCEQGEIPNPNMGYDYSIGDNGELGHIGLLDGDKFYPITDCICMKTAQGTFELGWRPTSMDMLAEDWQIIN